MTTDLIRAKIIELIPSKKWRYTCGQCQFETVIEESPSLAGVLRAIEAKTRGFVDLDHDENEAVWREAIEKDAIELLRIWNLLEPYDNQTQETKDFIGTLIGV